MAIFGDHPCELTTGKRDAAHHETKLFKDETDWRNQLVERVATNGIEIDYNDFWAGGIPSLDEEIRLGEIGMSEAVFMQRGENARNLAQSLADLEGRGRFSKFDQGYGLGDFPGKEVRINKPAEGTMVAGRKRRCGVDLQPGEPIGHVETVVGARLTKKILNEERDASPGVALYDDPLGGELGPMNADERRETAGIILPHGLSRGTHESDRITKALSQSVGPSLRGNQPVDPADSSSQRLAKATHGRTVHC